MSDVLIAGGGIGGLATALSVARRGHRVTVLERRDEFTELGAGIQLAPNAFHALDSLGVGGAVRERAVYVDELRFMDGTTGDRVASMPLTDAYRSRFGNPYVVVHRIDLYQPLIDACRDSDAIELVSGCSVTRYEQDSSGVKVFSEDGRVFTGSILLAADGIRSTIRQQFVADGQPRISGHTIYRSVIPIDRVPESLRWNTVTLWAGPKWHFVHYPIGSGEFLNLAATRDDGADEVVVGRPAEREHVLSSFPDLSDTARQLLELGESWREWVLCDRDPIDEWVDGRVVLLGDAAHPMLQYAAQGACMALEDAVVIGDLLDSVADNQIQERLVTFCGLRRERASSAQLVARAIGTELYHPAGEEAKMRNKLLSSLSVDELYDRVSWLHGKSDFGVV